MAKTLEEFLGTSIKLGIVGSEETKFTPVTEVLARVAIHGIIRKYNADIVISGGCHLGGIDQWAIEQADKLNLGVIEYLPKTHNWEGGYKDRNLRIARNSDKRTSS
jgi:hypothetical protein